MSAIIEKIKDIAAMLAVVILIPVIIVIHLIPVAVMVLGGLWLWRHL